MEKFCSFCGTSPVRTVLIAYNSEINAGICDDCIAICGKIFANAEPSDGSKLANGQSNCTFCTFCKKSSKEVGGLIAGAADKAYICQYCLKEAAARILSELKIKIKEEQNGK